MDFKINKTDEWIWRTALCLLAVFAISQLWLGFVRSPSADDAMFLSVPKNWLNGYGWATSYSENPVNPDFTGPPALLLLAAWLIKLFGQQLWIAGMTGALVNLFLIGLCLQQIRQYWRHTGLAVFALVCGCIAGKPEDFASLIGYYTGALVFFLAACIAFNPCHSLARRAVLVGILAAVGLLLKLLLLPAFLVLCTCLVIHGYRQCNSDQNQRNSDRKTVAVILGGIALPLLISQGAWQLFRHNTLAEFSSSFLAAHREYGREFFLYHGSGIGQWQDATDKLEYVIRNADRNLYFIEESLALHGLRNPWLGDAPADVHHIVGWIFIALLLAIMVLSARNVVKQRDNSFSWICLATSSTILAYTAWFLLLAMAMSPGHFYFPMQWSILLLLLGISQLTPAHHTRFAIGQCAVIALLSFAVLLPVDSRKQAFFPAREQLITTEAMTLAASYLQQHNFAAPLAGCGYSGYPRHIEYLLPASQNFRDCLDVIEDHVFSADGKHYQWRSVPTFNIVFSLQTSGFNSASGMVMNACKHNMLYRNPEVFVFACTPEELQPLDLDKLMQEIHKNQRWYRTRLLPSAGG